MPSKSLKTKHFGTDIPRGRPRKSFGLKNFGLIFRSLKRPSAPSHNHFFGQRLRFPASVAGTSGRKPRLPRSSKTLLFSATKTGRPGHWSEPGEYNILFLGSILVISSQDSSALGYREFTQEGAMTISPFAAREGTSAPQWPNVKKCCRHLVPCSDLFVQSYAVPIFSEKKVFPVKRGEAFSG